MMEDIHNKFQTQIWLLLAGYDPFIFSSFIRVDGIRVKVTPFVFELTLSPPANL